MNNTRTKKTRMNNDNRLKYIQAFYLIIGFIFACRLWKTCSEYPLFPFQSDSVDWSFTWLMTTVYDFYTLSACFSGIVLATEPNMYVGLIWVFAINLLGSPFACLYMIVKLHQNKRLAIENSNGYHHSVINTVDHDC